VQFDPRARMAFTMVALLGVATTAINTLLLVAPASEASDSFRDMVLLVHAPATFFPMIAIALLGFRARPFLAVVAIAATFLEKSLEFVGQTLLVFPPVATSGFAAEQIISAIWGQLYFVLWCCNTLGATAAGGIMLGLAPPRWRWPSAAFAFAAAALTFVLLLGPDYIALVDIHVPALLFAVVFTGYRIALVATIWRNANMSNQPER
jgi:hypothetical protein